MWKRSKQGIKKITTEALILFLILIQSGYATAQDELSDSMITAKTEAIRQMLDQGKSNANRWWYGWLAGYGAATVVQSAFLITSEAKSNRQDLALGAATTLLGVAGQLVTPMVPGFASEKLKKYPGNTRDEKLARLAEAEDLLRQSALREKSGRSWKIHAVSTVVNAGSGLITWIGFDRNIWDGLGNFALNTVITEIQIFTQPTRAIKDYDNYVRQGSSQESFSRKQSLNWTVNIYPGGVAVRVVF